MATIVIYHQAGKHAAKGFNELGKKRLVVLAESQESTGNWVFIREVGELIGGETEKQLLSIYG